MAGKAGFKTVETDLEQLDEKIHRHRKKIALKTAWIIVLAALAIVLFNLWLALRSFDSYEIRNTVEQGDKSASQFADFQGNAIEYSNDGAVYKDSIGELIWNQAFEMSTPMVDMCEGYLVFYDQNGTEIYIMQRTGLQKKIETSMPIRTVCVASQGTIAVLMKEENNSYIKMYGKDGKELANGEFFGNQGSIPIDIALSSDAQKLAVDMIDITGGKVDTTITFYNFGSVGQNEIDNNVGSFSYENTLIPEIKYVSDKNLIAIGDNKLLIFEGAQKPKLLKQIDFEKELESVFYDTKYVGTIYNNQDEESTHHIKVYDLRGRSVMENDTEMNYERVEFLSNHEICITNDYECVLYTIHGIKKFYYKFDVEIYKILSGTGLSDYTFILDGRMDEVHLK